MGPRAGEFPGGGVESLGVPWGWGRELGSSLGVGPRAREFPGGGPES